MQAPTTPVLCRTCGTRVRGTECADGFRVRRHRDGAGRSCQGAYRLDHLPVLASREDRVQRWAA